jgi:hypothetical protein
MASHEVVAARSNRGRSQEVLSECASPITSAAGHDRGDLIGSVKELEVDGCCHYVYDPRANGVSFGYTWVVSRVDERDAWQLMWKCVTQYYRSRKWSRRQ